MLELNLHNNLAMLLYYHVAYHNNITAQLLVYKTMLYNKYNNNMKIKQHCVSFEKYMNIICFNLKIEKYNILNLHT